MPADPASVSFGVNAAKAMEDGKIDGFWANGMGAEVAVKRGIGTLVLDARRGDGPASLRGYTFGVLATRADLVEKQPEKAAAAVRALVKTQKALKEDPSARPRSARSGSRPSRRASLRNWSSAICRITTRRSPRARSTACASSRRPPA